MSATDHVGRIAELWRFPVKSMGGERLSAAELTPDGLLGDRAYALIDIETGHVVSAKNTRQYPGLMACGASFLEPPRAGRPMPGVRIELPDGAMALSDGGQADAALSAHFGRPVRLTRTAPDDFTIDQHHPDIAGADPAGHRDVTVQQRLGAAFFAAAGMESPVAAGALFDLFPVSVMTTSTLRRLRALHPAGVIDNRRFRMNVIVDTAEDGFAENGWLGRSVLLGEAAVLSVAMPDPRCVMTTLAQGDLPQDADVLRTLVAHNRIAVVGDTRFPCAGVYAVTATAGRLALGDGVRLT